MYCIHSCVCIIPYNIYMYCGMHLYQALNNNAPFPSVLVVREIEEETDDTYFTSIVVDSSSIQVPFELVREVVNGTGPVTVAAVYYRNMSGLLPGTLPGENGSVLASPVVSTSLQCGQGICDTTNVELSQPVIVTVKHSLLVRFSCSVSSSLYSSCRYRITAKKLYVFSGSS